MKFLSLFTRTGIAGLFLLCIIQQVLHSQNLSQSPEELFKCAYTFYVNADLEQAYPLFSELSKYYKEEKSWEEFVYVTFYQSLINRIHREFDHAEYLTDKAEKILNEYIGDDHVYYSLIYNNRAHISNANNDLDGALSWAEKSIEIVNKHVQAEVYAVRSYGVLGFILDSKGDYTAALNAYKKGIEAAEMITDEQKKNFSFTLLYNNLGVAYRRAGNPDKAMEYYQKNRYYQGKLFGDDHPEIALSYNNIGAIYYLTGDIGRAAQYFLRSASILENHHGKNHELVAAAYNNAGSSYFRLEKLEEAIRYLEMAQEIKVSILGPNHLDTAIGHSNLASIYMSDKDYEASLENYNLSLSIRINNFGDRHPSLVNPYMQRGKLYYEIDEPFKALQDFQQVTEIVSQRMGDSHPDMADALIQIGHVNKSINQYEEAQNNYQQAIVHLADDFHAMDIHENPSELTTAHPLLLLFSLASKSDLLIDYYLINAQEEYLKTAYDSYVLSLRLIEELQMKYQHEASKLNLFGENFSIFEGALLSAYYLYDLTDEKKYLESIYTIMEQGKARIATELLQESQARTFAGVPDIIIEYEREINTAIASLHQRLIFEKEKGENIDLLGIRALQDSLFVAHKEQSKWIEFIEEEYPSYYEIKYSTQVPALEVVQNDLLEDESVVLNYFLGRDDLFVLVVSRNEVTIHKMNADKGLAESIEEVRWSVINRDDSTYRYQAAKLYDQLLRPIEGHFSGYRNLLIIPDHYLHYLPFEYLLKGPALSSRPDRWPYLIRDYQISYVPSLTVYANMRQKREININNLLAIAPYIDFPSNLNAEEIGLREYAQNLTPLPITRYETQEIAKIFTAQRRFWNVMTPKRNVTLLHNQDASREALINLDLHNFGYLHFATHAFIHETNPSLSGIMLAYDGKGENIIFLDDIYNLRLNAKLVSLSACDTGIGSLARGEGIIGFTRAFISGGAQNLLVSMWKVDDRATSELMVRFYRELFSGAGKAEALRIAKLSLIERPDNAFPDSWASFILIGS